MMMMMSRKWHHVIFLYSLYQFQRRLLRNWTGRTVVMPTRKSQRVKLHMMLKEVLMRLRLTTVMVMPLFKLTPQKRVI